MINKKMERRKTYLDQHLCLVSFFFPPWKEKCSLLLFSFFFSGFVRSGRENKIKFEAFPPVENRFFFFRLIIIKTKSPAMQAPSPQVGR